MATQITPPRNTQYPYTDSPPTQPSTLPLPLTPHQPALQSPTPQPPTNPHPPHPDPEPGIEDISSFPRIFTGTENTTPPLTPPPHADAFESEEVLGTVSPVTLRDAVEGTREFGVGISVERGEDEGVDGEGDVRDRGGQDRRGEDEEKERRRCLDDFRWEPNHSSTTKESKEPQCTEESVSSHITHDSKISHTEKHTERDRTYHEKMRDFGKRLSGAWGGNHDEKGRGGD